MARNNDTSQYNFTSQDSRLRESDYYLVESEPAIAFREETLVRYKLKLAGKNRHKLDGFYKDSQGYNYFIKKPNPSGFFAELLAGKIIQTLKKEGYIDEIYHDSLIVSDVIDLGEEGYALIQPAMPVRELFKIISTGGSENTNRSAPLEIIRGVELYPLPFVNGKEYFGLSLAVMVSLWLGDYSLHSANIVALVRGESSEQEPTQYSKLDWDAAFRDFVDPDNHNDILQPKEYQGLFNIDSMIKGFISYYRNIPGFFSAVSDKAVLFYKNLSLESIRYMQELFAGILQSCMGEIPPGIVAALSEKDIRYFGFAAEDVLLFRNNRQDFFKNYFIKKFSQTLSIRLTKLMSLQTESLTCQRFMSGVKDTGSDKYRSITPGEKRRMPISHAIPGIYSPPNCSQSCTCCDYKTIVRYVENVILSEETKNELANIILKNTRMGCPLDRQLFVEIPSTQVSLPIENNQVNKLSHYLGQEAEANGGKKRLIAIPLHIGKHSWIALMLYINSDNNLSSVCMINCQLDPFSDLNMFLIPFLFKELSAVYKNFQGTIKEYSFNGKDGRTSEYLLALNLKMMLFRAYFGRNFEMITHVVCHRNEVSFTDNSIQLLV